jgi:HSP20 family molecular chaperone IbpA
MTEPHVSIAISYREWRHDSILHYVVDLPGVLDPDLDIAVEGPMLVVRAQRTLPEQCLLLCRLPVPGPYDVDGLVVRFEWGVLEVILPAKGS